MLEISRENLLGSYITAVFSRVLTDLEGFTITTVCVSSHVWNITVVVHSDESFHLDQYRWVKAKLKFIVGEIRYTILDDMTGTRYDTLNRKMPDLKCTM